MNPNPALDRIYRMERKSSTKSVFIMSFQMMDNGSCRLWRGLLE
jgi:hypothetical protein